MSWFSNQPCSSRREGTWSSERDAWSTQGHAKPRKAMRSHAKPHEATQSLHTLTAPRRLLLSLSANSPVLQTQAFPFLCALESPWKQSAYSTSVFVPEVFIVGLHIKTEPISYHLIFLKKTFLPFLGDGYFPLLY